MDNMISVERVKIGEALIEGFKALIETSKTEEQNKKTEKKLAEVYKVQDEIGATKAIAAKEKFVQIIESKISSRKKSDKNMEVEVMEVPSKSINSELENDIVDEELEI